MKRKSSREVSVIALLAALYAAASFLPISVYIGGEGFITANVVILPLIAYVLDPLLAALTAGLGSIAMYAAGASITPIYGIMTPLVPLSGALIGSLAKKSRFAAVPWMLLGIVSYLVWSGGTALWVLFYLVPMGTALIPHRWRGVQVLNVCAAASIAELVAMDLGSIFLLGFQGFLWLIILPFAVYERAVAIVGSYLLVRVFDRYRARLFA